MDRFTTQDTTLPSFEPCRFNSRRKPTPLSPISPLSSSLLTSPSLSRQLYTIRFSDSLSQGSLDFVRTLLPPPFISATRPEAHSSSHVLLSLTALPVDEASFLRDLHFDATRRTANFSRFLHLVLLATGCRYLVDASSFLCRDGDQSSRGLVFIDAAKTLVDEEGTSPKLSSITSFLLLSSFMVGMGTE